MIEIKESLLFESLTQLTNVELNTFIMFEYETMQLCQKQTFLFLGSLIIKNELRNKKHTIRLGLLLL